MEKKRVHANVYDIFFPINFSSRFFSLLLGTGILACFQANNTLRKEWTFSRPAQPYTDKRAVSRQQFSYEYITMATPAIDFISSLDPRMSNFY